MGNYDPAEADDPNSYSLNLNEHWPRAGLKEALTYMKW